MGPNHPIIKSFQFALAGLKIAVKDGRNFRIQLVFATLAILSGIIFHLSNYEWLCLILIVTAVLILELINTSIEQIVNMVSPEIRESARIAKDVSAGAVLVAAIASVFIGAFLFLPKIWS